MPVLVQLRESIDPETDQRYTVKRSENSEFYFYRSNAGGEIDFLYIDQQNQPVPIEIKYSLSPAISRGFWNAYEDLGCTRGYVIYPGNEMYPLGKNVSVLPLDMLESVLAHGSSG